MYKRGGSNENSEPKNAGNVPQSPQICHVDGCGKETGVLITVVRNCMTSKLEYGCFSQFGDNSNPKAPQMKDGYLFVRFIARCTGCYCNDVARAVDKANPSKYYKR